jgi:hypothetical protein
MDAGRPRASQLRWHCMETLRAVAGLWRRMGKAAPVSSPHGWCPSIHCVCLQGRRRQSKRLVGQAAALLVEWLRLLGFGCVL